MIDLKQILIDNEYDYLTLFENNKTIKNLSNDDRDINFIIGVKDRTDFFRATIKNVLKSIEHSNKNCNLRVKLIVVEQNYQPINNQHCRELNIDYIFIPQELSNSYNLHSTALMYNTGYLFSKEAKWNMFHCCDILLPEHFFYMLERMYLKKDFNWLQPFNKKRVITLDTETTNNYLNDLNASPDPNTIPMDKLHPENSGAPGGCICIPTNIMDKVGGYDPEIFYGYSPEDAFIWVKLECITKNEKITGTHVGGALYADCPVINLFHFNHPRAQNENPKYELMVSQYESFIKDFTYDQQVDYINTKSDIFVKIKKVLYEKSINNIL